MHGHRQAIWEKSSGKLLKIQFEIDCRLCHASRDPPQKYVTHLGPPILVGLVQKHGQNPYRPTHSLSIIVRGGFLSREFCQRVLCREGFVRGYVFCQNTSVATEN